MLIWDVARRDVTVCILDRPRHADLIRQCREAGARIRLISDGDVAGEADPLLLPSPDGLMCLPEDLALVPVCYPCMAIPMTCHPHDIPNKTPQGSVTPELDAKDPVCFDALGVQEDTRCDGLEATLRRGVTGAIETAKAGSPVDIMLGIGGTPEGVLRPLLDCAWTSQLASACHHAPPS